MKIGVLFASGFEQPGEYLADARAMEAAGVDSIWLEEREGLDPLLTLAAVAAVTGVVRLVLITDRPLDQRQVDTLQQLSRGRFLGRPASSERWIQVDAPADREAWAATLNDAGGNADGIVVPMGPRLLDLLRNPDQAVDRSDLLLASG